MFRSKLKTALLIAASIFLLFILAFCGLFVYIAPDHPVNIALFKFAYNSTAAKKSLLEFYSPYRRDVNGRSLPGEVDEFLCQKIETTEDQEEFSAIVHLYAMQAGGREGNRIFKVSDPVRQKIAAEIIKQMDENPNLWGQLILLEEIRLGKSLGKGNIGNRAPPYPSSKEDWDKWKEEFLPIGKQKYQEWWQSNSSWEEKKKINPLEGSAIRINSCCG